MMSPPRGSDEAIQHALQTLEAYKRKFQSEVDHGHSPADEIVDGLELAIDNAESQFKAAGRQDHSTERLLNTLLDCREDVAKALAMEGDDEGRRTAIRKYNILLKQRELAQSKPGIRT